MFIEKKKVDSWLREWKRVNEDENKIESLVKENNEE